MPSGISNEVKTNRLDKKINFGVSRTASDDTIPPENEAESSPITLTGHTIWKNSGIFLLPLLELILLMYKFTNM